MWRTIAARLLEAKTTIPHFYLQSEVDAEPLVQLRQQLNASNERPVFLNSPLTISSLKQPPSPLRGSPKPMLRSQEMPSSSTALYILPALSLSMTA